MSEILSTILEGDELLQVPQSTRDKLEKDLELKSSSIDAAQCEVERVRADYEQKCYEIDKKMIEMSSRLDSEASNCTKSTTRCQELEAEVKSMREKSSALEMSFAESQGEIAALKHTRDMWKDEKLSMQHLVEKRDLEITQLKGEWKTMADKLTIVSSGKNQAELKLDEFQNSGVNVEYHNKRLERENELLQQQNQQLTDEVSSKSSELNSIKLQKENELVSLRGRLEVKMEECKQLLVTSENLRTSNDSFQEKITSLMQKINTVEEEHRSMEELYRNELQSQVKLAELYKASTNDEEQKSNELASAVQELQKIVTGAEEANKQLQVELKESENKCLEMLKEVEMGKKELEKANDLLLTNKSQLPNLSEEDLAALSPAAAMASKFIKSGMTLTEIYTKYVEAVDELDVSKQENKRLNDAMDAILEELNEKAPILNQQRDDYERALATITQLTSQMDAAAIENQQLRAEADDATRKLGRVARENKRLQMETKDLSTQVRFLLKELEESRGRQVNMSPGNSSMMEDDSNVTSSSEVITGRLVTFKNIEELQKQNQKLLQVIRELSDEKEKEEGETRDGETKHLKENLDLANEELERLREDRDRQIEFVEAIVRQRDMYRVLLAQESTDLPLSVFSTPAKPREQIRGDDTTPKKKAAQESTEQTTKALQVLKTEFDDYKKEVQENNKVMNEQTESLRSQIAELRADNAKLQANVDFSAEKYNIMKQSFDNSRKESDMHRERNSKLMLLVQKHEMSLNNLSNELGRVQQEKKKLEIQLETTRRELDILRRAEDRLQSENSSLKRDQQGQSVLLTNLQKIQQTMEKQEFEVRSELRNRLESQDRELKSLRRNNNESIQQKQLSLQMTEKQLLTTRQKLEKQQTLCDTLSNELKTVKAELDTTKLEKQNNASKLAALEQRLSRLASQKSGNVSSLDADDDVAENLKLMKAKCNSLQEEVSSQKLKLDKAQRGVQQHKEVATAAEESLKQANISNKELSQALEARLRRTSEQQTKLEQKITTLEEENRQLNNKKTSLISEVDLRTADLNKQLTTLKNELDLCMGREKESRKNEQDARKQFTEQTEILHEAQNKYQREMLLHAESVRELVALKEKMNKHNSELENALNDSQQAKHLFDSQKGMWEKQTNKMAEENNQIKQRNEDMNGQLALLHAQIETMSNQMLVLQQKQTTSPARYSKPFRKETLAASADSIEDTNDKSHEQLMDIIKFLRKEKNVFEMKFEVAQSESNRLKQQLLHIQKQSDETKKLLQDEQHKSQASSSELTKHEALMKKVENLNVLSDSNRMLREEKERLQETFQTTKAELNEVKQKITPLQTENNQLTTQIATLKSEKTMLEQDVQRWQLRSQQLIQSPRRQDPEDHRRLVNEKQKLSRSIDQLNKELTEKKLEVSNLQGEIRNFNQQVETQKSENTSLSQRAETAEAEVKTKQAEVEEKSKMILQIRRVGRRYKASYEELQKKQQEQDANQKSAEESKSQDVAVSEAVLAENNAKLAALEASLLKITKEKDEMMKKMEESKSEIETLKNQLQKSSAKSTDESKVSSSEIAEEHQKVVNERDEMKKQLQEKEEKSKRLLTLAKNRIEHIRKEKEEMASERDRVRSEEEKLKEEVERLKQSKKLETEQKNELQNKVEELQRQLTSVSSQQQQQNKVTSVVGHHHHAGTSGTMEMRKAANIRPISTQRVSQVSPMRVTRTARVMPEPQQEAQEGTSSESITARSSPHAQVAPSSTHAVSSINVNTSSSSTQPTRAFVHPINPTSTRQQNVVSSMPTSSASHQLPSRSDIHPSETVIIRSTNTSSGNQAQESSSAASSSGNVEVSESDQAIVSSSDDQPVIHEEGPQQSNMPSGSSQPQTSVLATVTESEAPSQSSASSSDGSGVASSGTISGIPLHITRQGHTSHKRSYDDAEEASSGIEETPASSSDAHVPSVPVSKRQRSSPDQSSAAAIPMTTQAHTSRQFAENTTRVEQAESSDHHSEDRLTSNEGEGAKSLQLESQEIDEEAEDVVDTSTFVPIPEVGQAVPTSSGAEDVIVLSSDSEEDGNNLNIEQGQEEMYNDDEDSNGMMVETEDNEGEASLQDLVEQVPLSSTRPLLVLHPTPPDFITRSRPPIRPAPLTPGLGPPAADDEDGIVPCTPTLPTRRHDDNYQTINSPHVPPGGPPIRFRFEESFQSQGGIGSVDNTLMDFSSAGEEASRNVPAAPLNVSSITTITHTIVDAAEVPSSEVSAVSSSNTEQEEGELGEEKDEIESEMCVPISSSLSEDTARDPAEARETTSNLQNIRGRRIKLIGARSRGKGATSPSTSNQQ